MTRVKWGIELEAGRQQNTRVRYRPECRGGKSDGTTEHLGSDRPQLLFRRCLFYIFILSSVFFFFQGTEAHHPLGPEGYWQFDEGNGFIAIDNSDHWNTGVLVNGPIWTTGKVGSALSFDGVNDYVDAGNAASLNPARQISIAAWIRTTTTDASQFIVAKDNQPTGTLQYYLSVRGGGAIRFGIRTSANNFMTTTACSIAPNTWHHVAGVYNSVDMRIYINGVLSGTPQSVTGLMVNNGVSTRIGVRQDGASPFSGLIDEVRVYDRALTANEVAALSSVGDTTPPLISAVSSSNFTARSATISWITDEPADSRVEYGTTTAYGLTTALDPSLISLHFKDLSNLFPGTTYHYRVVSADAARNPSASGDFTFTTVTTVPANSGPVGVMEEWRFDDGIGIRAADTSGHRKTGTLVNGLSGPPER